MLMHRRTLYLQFYMTLPYPQSRQKALQYLLSFATQQKPLKRTQEKCCMLAIRKQRARLNIIRLCRGPHCIFLRFAARTNFLRVFIYIHRLS